jgi:hypothetical protein
LYNVIQVRNIKISFKKMIVQRSSHAIWGAWKRSESNMNAAAMVDAKAKLGQC